MNKPICFDGVFRFDMDCGTPMYNTFDIRLVRPEPNSVEAYVKLLHEAVDLAHGILSKDCRRVEVVYLSSSTIASFRFTVYQLDKHKNDPYLVTYRLLRKVIPPGGFNHTLVPQ